MKFWIIGYAPTSERTEVFTASYKGWDEVKNGKLLQTAEYEGVEVFLTGDKSLIREQTFAERRLVPYLLFRFAPDSIRKFNGSAKCGIYREEPY